MDEKWQKFRERFEAAVAAQLSGNSEPFKALWSHKPDVTIFGGLGGHEQGWPEVGIRLDWASKLVVARHVRLESLKTVVGPDMALTVDLEHMIRTVDGREIERALRCTQIYRLEDGDWRIFHRHADEYRPSGR